jgi:hypothetical protein
VPAIARWWQDGAAVATDHKDYSSTPLPKKLGIREGSLVLIVNAPAGFTETLSPLPTGVELRTRASKGLDVVVVFATRLADLRRRVGALVFSLDTAGRLWVVWPKRAANVATDITFAEAQAVGLDAGLVDNKSSSITNAYQGLQFVYRLRDRPRS